MMNPQDFDSAAARTRRTPRVLEAARLVLVERFSGAEAGRQTGVTRQRVHQVVRQILGIHADLRGCPDGFESVTVCVPAGRAGEVREHARRLTQLTRE